MQVNQEFVCFEQNEKFINQLAQKNNHQEILNFCDKQINFIKFQQCHSQEAIHQILSDSLELNRTLEQSSGSFILSKVDSFNDKFKIETAYEFYYKKKIQSLHILKRFQEIIECCDQLLILCKENNQENYCLNEKAFALLKIEKINELIKLKGLDKQENIHNLNYYKQITKGLKNKSLIDEAILCWDYGIQNNQFQKQFYHKKIKLLNKYGKVDEADICSKLLGSLNLS